MALGPAAGSGWLRDPLAGTSLEPAAAVLAPGSFRAVPGVGQPAFVDQYTRAWALSSVWGGSGRRPSTHPQRTLSRGPPSHLCVDAMRFPGHGLHGGAAPALLRRPDLIYRGHRDSRTGRGPAAGRSLWRRIPRISPQHLRLHPAAALVRRPESLRRTVFPHFLRRAERTMMT